jgi:hypothetical protein
MKRRLSLVLSILFISFFLLGLGSAFAWSEQANTFADGLNMYFYGVSALDDNNVWAVGYDNTNWRGTIYYYDGTDWAEQANTAGEDVEFYGVSALDADNVWAVGYDNGIGGIGGGTIYHFNGTEWAEQAGIVGVVFFSVSAPSANNVWAVGYNWDLGQGTIYHYNGSDWQEQFTTEAEDVEIHSVSALDANNVWAAGYDNFFERGTIYYYDGLNWSEEANTGGADIEFRDISMTSGSVHGWAAGFDNFNVQGIISNKTVLTSSTQGTQRTLLLSSNSGCLIATVTNGSRLPNRMVVFILLAGFGVISLLMFLKPSKKN